MMICAVFTVIFASSDSKAAFSSWNKGDKWALKGEKDMGLAYSSMNEFFTMGDDDEIVSNLTISEFSITGYTGVYILFEVTDVSETEYTLKITAVQNITLASTLSGSGEYLGPGSYIGYWTDGVSQNPDDLLNVSEASKAIQDVGYDMKIAIGMKEIAVLKLDKETMAIKSMAMDASSYARGNVNMVNYPNSTTWTDDVNDRRLTNVTYETFDCNITMDAQIYGNITFDPAFELLADSPAEGSTWEPQSIVNMTGTISGSLNIEGLTPNMKYLLFHRYEDQAKECGITGFPIDLAAIHSLDQDQSINNGTMSITNMTIEPEYTNLQNKTINDPVFGSIEVNQIGWNNGGSSDLTFYYYPAKGYIVGTQTPISSILGIDIVFSTKSVPVADVQSAIDKISAQMEDKMTYDEIADAAKGAGSNTLSNLLPIIAIVAIALVLAIGAFYVLVCRKRPKN